MNFFIKIFFLILITSAFSEASVPWLKTEGKWLKDTSGNNVTLRGVSMCEVTDPVGWQNTLEDIKKDIEVASQEWKARVVRLPVNPPLWRKDKVSYEQKLDAAIEKCKQEKIYCILDYHVIGGSTSYGVTEPRLWTESSVHTNVVEFWNYFAPKYKDVPNVIYELFNEPVEPSADPSNDILALEVWQKWKTIAQPWVNLIRTHAPNNIIIVGSPGYSQFTRMAAKSPFEGKNLAYTAHFYSDWSRLVAWENPDLTGSSLQKKMETAKKIHEKLIGEAAAKVPVFMTEWGFAPDRKPTSGGDYYKDHWRAFKNEYGEAIAQFMLVDYPNINWTAWAFHDACGPQLVDSARKPLDGTFFDQLVTINGSTFYAKGSYAGQFVKDLLIKNYNVNAPSNTVTTKTYITIEISGDYFYDTTLARDIFPKVDIYIDNKLVVNDREIKILKSSGRTQKIVYEYKSNYKNLSINYFNDINRGPGKNLNIYVHSIKVGDRLYPLTSIKGSKNGLGLFSDKTFFYMNINGTINLDF